MSWLASLSLAAASLVFGTTRASSLQPRNDMEEAAVPVTLDGFFVHSIPFIATHEVVFISRCKISGTVQNI